MLLYYFLGKKKLYVKKKKRNHFEVKWNVNQNLDYPYTFSLHPELTEHISIFFFFCLILLFLCDLRGVDVPPGFLEQLAVFLK